MVQSYLLFSKIGLEAPIRMGATVVDTTWKGCDYSQKVVAKTKQKMHLALKNADANKRLKPCALI